VILAPGQVHKLGIDAAAENLRVAILELVIELTEGRDLVGQTKVNPWPEK